MSMLLYHDSENAFDQNAIWGEVIMIAEHGVVPIDVDAAIDIARLLQDAKLSNGDIVIAAVYDDDQAAYVSSFGPSLLPVYLQDRIRERLANGEFSKQAVRLFNLCLRLELRMSVNGLDASSACISIYASEADRVDISRSSHWMFEMLDQLGISNDREARTGEVDFETFRQSVDAHSWKVDIMDELEAFVACGLRHGATKVTWE